MTFEIREVGTRSQSLAEVLALHRSNRKVLGFLPDEGFLDRARQGTLLAAIAQGSACGYVLYDLPGDRVKIVHLCVAASRRRAGVARALIQHLDTLHPDRRCLQLACRRDFPANALWPKLGFSPLAERSGRSHAGHPLTIWQRSYDHDDLFTIVDERRDIAAIDCNIFKDLTSTRTQGRHTRRLRDDWVSELIELRVTDELYHEINRCEDREERGLMQREASSFGKLPKATRNWRDLVTSVGELAPRAGEADHNQVARSLAANARYFVTRDGELLKAAPAIHEQLQILITRPEDLILHLDRQRYAGGYEPQALQATSVSRIDIDQVDQDDLVVAFLNYGAGERASGLRDLIRSSLAAPREHDFRIFHTADGTLAGALILAAGQKHIEAKLMRVSDTGKLGGAVARQLAFLPRQAAADRGVGCVLVSDPAPSGPVAAALREEFYTPVHEGWSCSVRRGVEAASSPTDGDKKPWTPDRAAAYERSHWPRKLLGTGLPTFMLSIHPTYAAQLFDTNLAEQTLFGRDLDLGLSREHVYYRGCGWRGGLVAPARVLWYVKGTSRAPGYLSAVSALREVTIGRPRSLHQRFVRLGVWDRQEVTRAAGKNTTVMALRFTDTELLAQPLDLHELREVYAEQGASFRAPQSPCYVPEHMFYLLYRRASAYGT